MESSVNQTADSIDGYLNKKDTMPNLDAPRLQLFSLPPKGGQSVTVKDTEAKASSNSNVVSGTSNPFGKVKIHRLNSLGSIDAPRLSKKAIPPLVKHDTYGDLQKALDISRWVNESVPEIPETYENENLSEGHKKLEVDISTSNGCEIEERHRPNETEDKNGSNHKERWVEREIISRGYRDSDKSHFNPKLDSEDASILVNSSTEEKIYDAYDLSKKLLNNINCSGLDLDCTIESSDISDANFDYEEFQKNHKTGHDEVCLDKDKTISDSVNIESNCEDKRRDESVDNKLLDNGFYEKFRVNWTSSFLLLLKVNGGTLLFKYITLYLYKPLGSALLEQQC